MTKLALLRVSSRVAPIPSSTTLLIIPLFLYVASVQPGSTHTIFYRYKLLIIPFFLYVLIGVQPGSTHTIFYHSKLLIIPLFLYVSIKEEWVISCTLKEYLESKIDEKIMPQKTYLLMRFGGSFAIVREFQNLDKKSPTGMECCKMLVKGIYRINSVTSYY